MGLLVDVAKAFVGLRPSFSSDYLRRIDWSDFRIATEKGRAGMVVPDLPLLG
jgi:hypothetical protein